MITKEIFGTLENGENVYLYKLDNHTGLSAEIITFGGIVKNLWVEKNGVKTDVVFGRDTLEEYLNNKGSYGALIGRHANRIKNAEFEINGEIFKLAKNNGNNSHHGGIVGFSKRNWASEEAGSENEPALILTYTSADGEEGFPGKLDVKVTYTLTSKNSLHIHYEAVSDKDTVVNLTNHSYFNLNGHADGPIDNHTLMLNCDFFTPNCDEGFPYGEILSVNGTPFDFRTPKLMGQNLYSDYPQIKDFGGYDHNFVINGRGYRKAAVLSGDKTGITMETYTDKPGVQIYTGKNIEQGRVCKDGAVYAPYHAICFETQFFPNGTYVSHFPSPFLKKDEKYDFTTEYRFI